MGTRRKHAGQQFPTPATVNLCVVDANTVLFIEKWGRNHVRRSHSGQASLAPLADQFQNEGVCRPFETDVTPRFRALQPVCRSG